MLKRSLKEYNITAAIFAILTASLVHAATFYDGHTGQPTSIDELFKAVGPGTVLITSEQHDHAVHHQNQKDILKRLATMNLSVSVGMEFFYYPQQPLVDAYVVGHLDEATFLKQIGWGKLPFDFYREQVLAPMHLGGTTVALNFPWSLSGKVAQGGLQALTDQEKTMIPPNFERGTDTYFARFRETMKGHAPDSAIENYFTAQSLWDDTMAWKAAEHMIARPNDLLMIIVGDFHVAYQDGLVARLKKRGVTHIVSLSQIDTTGMNDTDRRAQIMPDATYGVRADFIFDQQ